MKKNKKFIAKRLSTKKVFNKSEKKYFDEVIISDEEEVLIIPDLEVGADVDILVETADAVTVEDVGTDTFLIPEEDVEIVVEDGVIAEINPITETEEELKEDDEEEEKEENEEEEKKEDLEIDPEVLSKITELETRIDALEAKLAETETEEFKNKKFTEMSPADKRVESLRFLQTLKV